MALQIKHYQGELKIYMTQTELFHRKRVKVFITPIFWKS